MHPILARRERLLAYLLAWIPLAAIQAYLMALPGSLSLAEAAALAAPLSLVYAFLCLSSFYACRSAPLTRARTGSVLGVHAAGAFVAAALLTLAGSTLASLLGAFPALSTLPERFGSALLPLFVLGLLLYLLAVTLHYILLSLESSQAAERRAMEARVLAREAELEALKAQLNPHFLFNALNSVMTLITSDPPAAQRMLVRLSELLRITLATNDAQEVSVEQELALVERYLEIERIRFGDRLAVVIEADAEARGSRVPALLLQPLVENAIVHGLSQRPGPGRVEVRARVSGSNVVLSVRDDGPGVRRPSAHAGAGIGLGNLRARLERLYGEAFELAVSDDPRGGACVTVVVPGARAA